VRETQSISAICLTIIPLTISDDLHQYLQLVHRQRKKEKASENLQNAGFCLIRF